MGSSRRLKARRVTGDRGARTSLAVWFLERRQVRRSILSRFLVDAADLVIPGGSAVAAVVEVAAAAAIDRNDIVGLDTGTYRSHLALALGYYSRLGHCSH